MRWETGFKLSRGMLKTMCTTDLMRWETGFKLSRGMLKTMCTLNEVDFFP